jgi:hypothetical protein
MRSGNSQGLSRAPFVANKHAESLQLAEVLKRGFGAKCC